MMYIDNMVKWDDQVDRQKINGMKDMGFENICM